MFLLPTAGWILCEDLDALCVSVAFLYDVYGACRISSVCVLWCNACV
jgi:hypothetical protein